MEREQSRSILDSPGAMGDKKSKIEKNRIAAALSEKVCVYSIKEGKFAN